MVRVLAEQPNMNHAGANVTLSISSKGLQLTVLDTGQLISQHDMPNISFASGGDPVSKIVFFVAIIFSIIELVYAGHFGFHGLRCQRLEPVESLHGA